jgi:hypothetical protein
MNQKPICQWSSTDPVAAYDLISRVFPAVAQRRKPYLDAIDDLIVEPFKSLVA